MTAAVPENGIREVHLLRITGMPVNQLLYSSLQSLGQRLGVQCKSPEVIDANEAQVSVFGTWGQVEYLAQEIMDGALDKLPVSIAIQNQSGMLYYLRREDDCL